jgi:hypothetical protein
MKKRSNGGMAGSSPAIAWDIQALMDERREKVVLIDSIEASLAKLVKRQDATYQILKKLTSLIK